MIVKMKKAELVVLKEDKDRLMKSLQKYGELMLITSSDNEQFHEVADDSQYLQRIEKSIKELKSYQEKSGRLGASYVVDYDEFMKADPKRKELLERIEKTNEDIARLESENKTLLDSIRFLEPWNDLDIRLSDLTAPKYANLHAGFVELRYLSTFENAISSYGGEIILLGRTNEGQALVFAVYYKDNEEVLEKVKNLGYVEQSLPAENKFVREIVAEKQSLIDRNSQRINDLQSELKELSSNVRELELLNDQINSQKELEKAHGLDTVSAVYLEGWVRKDRVDRLEKAVKESTDIYDLEISDPLPEEQPPTVTKNNAFVAPFETITDMFAKPSPYEVDPNPAMAPWYWLLFGIMMGDAGYGLVMAILFYLLIKVKKPKGNSLKLMRIFLYASIPTIFWGVLFGSYFGATWHPILLEPMAEPLPFLILSLAIGVLHILSGILMKAYSNLINGHVFDFFADQLSWISIIVGLCFLFIPVAALKSASVPMVAAGAVVVVLTAGRHKKRLIGKAISGVLSLYSVTGYMSDVLSYSRLLALSLSSAVIAMVMNMLAGMIQGSIIGFIFSIFIYIIGHTFNIVMGLLSAYVHDSRLQYIEFFGKFYEGGGYEFKPLSLKLKYIDEVNEKEN
jgi:V/A-type H+-transporting ATPase subunit I